MHQRRPWRYKRPEAGKLLSPRRKWQQGLPQRCYVWKAVLRLARQSPVNTLGKLERHLANGPTPCSADKKLEMD
jgi:hypothetical protein